MARKKKKRKVTVQPFCYYCDREFKDEPTLAQHQRARHFKCPFCRKRLGSGPALAVSLFLVSFARQFWTIFFFFFFTHAVLARTFSRPFNNFFFTHLFNPGTCDASTQGDGD